MGILRSEQMKHGTLVLPVDRARQFLDTIGSNTKIQFEDMNARDMHRPYKKYIQRVDEMERIMRFLHEELTRVPDAVVVKNNVDSFLDNSDEFKLDEVEARLKQMYKDFIQFKENNAQLTGKRNAALEERYVVQTAIASMAQVQQPSTRRPQNQGDDFEFQASRHLLEGEGGRTRALETMFSNIAGVIPQDDQDKFARTLFRATRGNTFTHFQQIFEPMIDPKTGGQVHKSVFVVYFQDHRAGVSASAMNEKITKICGSYGVNTYRWPTSRESAEEMLRSLNVQVQDQERLLQAHEAFVRSEATGLLEPSRLCGNSLIEDWRLFAMKEKSIYATLNLFEGDMNLRANCWFPAAEEDDIRAILIRTGSEAQGSGLQSSAMLVSDRTAPRNSPPTYIRKNEFTGIFQELVDTYGLPRYGEANPALFAVVTFPFLFGVMFGDVGHGLMLFMVGAYAVMKSDELKHSLPELYQGRYIIFMMGFFAVYVGFLYNDFFSVGLTLFDSRYTAPTGGKVGDLVSYTPNFDTKNDGGAGPYPFGVDPAWHGAQNELVYMNSMKMKISVILGVTQMIVGLLLRFSNAFHTNNMVDLFCECVPMMIFMVSFFGWMDFLILYKWVTPMDNPPSIINSMIAMAMRNDDPDAMLGETLPTYLIYLSVLTVPWMLIPKPLIVLQQHNARQASSSNRNDHSGQGRPGGAGHVTLGDEECGPLVDDEHEEFDFAEMAIHQIIETIEYVLGTVSHTASYLRLWALSLAHQQLSMVFFNMTLASGLEGSFPLNIISIYMWFAVWFGITLAILLGMDVLECFLHTLRLHWVEFQSKFYKADGYAFEPFCHRTLAEKKTDD